MSHALFDRIETTFHDQIVPALDALSPKTLPYDKRISLSEHRKLLKEWEMSYLHYLDIWYVMKTEGGEADEYLFFDLSNHLLMSADNTQ